MGLCQLGHIGALHWALYLVKFFAQSDTYLNLWHLELNSYDQSRIRKGYAAENFAVVRHIALNLLKKDTSLKQDIAGKRKRAGWDIHYLEKLLG